MGPPAAPVLLEREDLLALAKPPGLSMATSARPGKSETDVVARLLAAAGLALEGPLPRLVHRLDVGTSGVVLLARSEAAHRLLSRALQERRAEKTYRALAWGHPVPARGSFDAPLGRDPGDGRRMAVRPDGKRAVTRYETLRRLPSAADLRLFPETGRTHQIRVHLAHRGHPIVGDDLYGGATRHRGVRDPRLRAAFAVVTRPLLHAERIEIPDLDLCVEAPLLADHEALLRLLGAPPES